MKWCVTSGGDEIRLRSYVNHYIWAHENGVDYRLDLGLAPGLRLPYDAKYAIIRRALRDFDWVMWVDDDVFFTRWTSGSVESMIEEAEAAGQFLVIAEGPMEPTGIWSRINSGVMLLRRDERTTRLLDLAQGTDVESLRPSWDFDEDGLFSGGDQDALWHAIKNVPELSAGTSIVGHAELNSRPAPADRPVGRRAQRALLRQPQADADPRLRATDRTRARAGPAGAARQVLRPATRHEQQPGLPPAALAARRRRGLDTRTTEGALRARRETLEVISGSPTIPA